MASLAARRPSLTFRLAIVVILLLSLAATGALYLAWEYGRRAADEAFDRLLTGASLQIAERIGVRDGKLTVDLPQSAFELLALARSDRVFYRIIGPEGRTVTGYDDLPEPPEPGSTVTPQIFTATYSGEPVRAAMAVRRISERELTGDVKVITAQTVRERSALARDITTKAAILVMAAGLAIIVLALFAVRYALYPLTRVERALLSRDPNDLSPFEIETPRELEAVVDAINRFTGRLDRRIGSVQAFVADAAHQLRTPITAIRAQAQLAVEESSRERLDRINRRIYDRSVAVGRLADQLLSKAMITHRGDTARREPLDLRRIAIEADDETRNLSAGATPVALDLPEDAVMVTGDRFSLREAVKNLIVNAQHYGKPPITIRVAAHDGHGTIGVRDRGTGIEKALRGDIGTRFKTSAGTRGSGLGLAIASEVAAFHGGTLECSDDGGFEIGLRLPLSEAQT
ncbi:MAG: sensor histidine kinase [Brucellaceae bacterium]|nr:sensor histidine kinase [Brucellaceae bacterium]